jgi:polyisoprenoid-binding protein YceI
MPVSSADIRLDFQNIAASTIRVRLNVAAARTNIPFATEAMTGPRVLDARNHPEIAFESTRIRASGGRAQVEGRLTIRGVTRPVTLAAEILSYGAGGEQDLSDLEIRLGTAVNRSDYGATGFADMVGDEVRILIVARILRAP